MTGRSCCADGSRELISGSLVSGIAASHPGKTGAQVSYKWVVQHDVALCLSADDSDHRVEAYAPCHQLAPTSRQQRQRPPGCICPDYRLSGARLTALVVQSLHREFTEDMDLFDWTLSDGEMSRLDASSGRQDYPAACYASSGRGR